jgi:hypothetical protein
MMKRPARYALAVASVTPLAALFLYLVVLEDFDPAFILGFLVILGPYVAVMFRAVNMGLYFTSEGVKNKNLFHTGKYAWNEIDHFHIKRPVPGTSNWRAWMVTRDGKRHSITGLEEYNWNMIAGNQETPATRAVDDLNSVLDRVRREGFDPSIKYFAELDRERRSETLAAT